jgi:DNA (cytosine-5)-methyltransferase 1
MKLISMFAGCGGMDLGFRGGFEYLGERFAPLGFELVNAYDFDAKAVETYRRNVDPRADVLDLSSYDPADLSAADVLVGGFPCQDFSSCGPQRGLGSERGRLFEALTKYMRHHRPRVVVAENVKNLEFMQDGAVLAHIMNEFRLCGYKVAMWRLYAPDYGVPQNRTRIIIVCVREDVAGFPECPVPQYAGNHRGTRWAIGDLETVDGESVPNHSQFFRAARAKKGNGQGDEVSKADRPAYTVRANAKSRIQFHYALDRRLTVRECARLQTFPDNFTFPYSNSQNVKMIGNAVPPMLAHRVASAIASFMSASSTGPAAEPAEMLAA